MRERFVFQREMRLRLASAAILIPATLWFTWFGELAFALVVTLTGALVLHEWLRMIGAGDLVEVRWAGRIGLALVAGLALTQPIAVAVAVAAIAAAAAAIAAWHHREDVRLRWIAAGLAYASVAVVAMIELRKGADGFGAVVFVFLVAWATDTFAFFVGRKLGGPRLWRRVSPSKTWSGALGGLVAGTLFGALVALWLKVPLTAVTLLAAALLAIAAQAGDLLESAAKRRFKIKDAGSLIPGHGGVMDRVDGLVAASAVAVVLGSAVSSETPADGLWTLMGR